MDIPKLNTKGNIIKREILFSAFTGLYFIIVLYFHVPFINFFTYRIGVRIQNPYFWTTIFILYLVTPLAAGFLNYKLSKESQFSYDKTLINGLIAAVTFVLFFLLSSSFLGEDYSLAALTGIIFFSSIFSFIIAALNTTLLSSILTKPKSNQP